MEKKKRKEEEESGIQSDEAVQPNLLQHLLRASKQQPFHDIHELLDALHKSCGAREDDPKHTDTHARTHRHTCTHTQTRACTHTQTHMHRERDRHAHARTHAHTKKAKKKKAPTNFGLHHPELGQVARALGRVRPKARRKIVHLAQALHQGLGLSWNPTP